MRQQTQVASPVLIQMQIPYVPTQTESGHVSMCMEKQLLKVIALAVWCNLFIFVFLFLYPEEHSPHNNLIENWADVINQIAFSVEIAC